ncbi:uncharacterized protein F4812DRAFT_457095 [Daldinia caldariorum]|uniref:uncharacterized protein n=1 Tax=Daldinia caldariorum TaxID=326644 RepID=UPI002007F71C|nr:uncharacterized protein F4812DRAFT_457095 [Daldinia caldariorum]KAI1469695.1 hypothetical protein F4812DRAFT_457095 [Daldinia caldariorum]
MAAQSGRSQSSEQNSSTPSGSTTSGSSTIARSMSRYRRKAGSAAVNVDATQKINSDPPPPWEPPIAPPVPVPTIPRRLTTASIRQKETDAPATALDSPPRHHLRHTESTRKYPPRRSTMDQYQNRPSTAKSAMSEESGWRRLVSRDGRRNRVNSEEEDEALKREVARLEAENRRLIAEQKRKDLQRLEIELANSPRPSFQAQSPKPRSPVLEKLALLTKGRKSRDRDGLSPVVSPTSSNASVEPIKSQITGIEVGGRGIVPQTDAPHSAINAGERNVAVRCKHHTFSVEVTPETTADDIIAHASKMTGSRDISRSNCVVKETYGALGLERCLRRYEHIRDVMNSWDRDTQNQLTVAMSESQDQDWELDIDSVPNLDEPPQGFQLYMYHSNRLGKWNKRWITLLENGQIISAKKPDAKSTDKDAASLCRLSDYDIYTPTESQMRRHLKPPKRYCFAVKSQQKTTVFINTENYVQYFCTEDPKIAAQFREKVQGWRSWYLVDRRPAAPKPSRKISIRKTDDKPPQITSPNVAQAPKKSANVASINGHRLQVSVDETPYAIGQFEPLIDMKRFDKRLSQFGQDFLPPVPDVSTMPKDITSRHTNSDVVAEKVEKNNKPERKLIDRINTTNDDGFTGNGLLGEGYEERRQAHVETDQPERGRQRHRNDAFTEGPSLLNRKTEPETPADKTKSSSWFPSALEHSARQRSVGSSSSSTRPSTSAGIVRTPSHAHAHAHARRPSLSSSRPPPLPSSNKFSAHEHPNPLSSQPTGLSHPPRHSQPKPLVDLEENRFQEAPQWARKHTGHGVKAPAGTAHLVDLISDKNGDADIPPRSALRRPSQTAPVPSLSRTRSKTQGAPPRKISVGGHVPPVPTLPERSGDREQLRSNPPPRNRDLEREREKAREKEREYNAYNSVPGRTGTLKVV